MSDAIRIYQGGFGRVALLDMDSTLVSHAHHHCHILIKVSGHDAAFAVGARIAPLTSETAVLVNAWQPHAYRHTATELIQRTVILALYIEPHWLAQIQHPLSQTGTLRYFASPSVTMSSHTRKLAEQLANEMCESTDQKSTEFESHLFDLISSVIAPLRVTGDGRQLFSKTTHVSIGDRRIRRAISIMKDNPSFDSQIDTLADQVGLSRAHFFSLFRECTNVTPLVYSNELRMESAITRLTGGEQSIATLSEAIGFSAPGHFSRFFRQHLGITPSDYRRVVDLFDSK